MKPCHVVSAVIAGLLLATASWAQDEPPKKSGATKGADFLLPVTPHVFSGDLRNLRKVPAWQPGDAIKEIPKRRRPPASGPAEPRGFGPDPLLNQQRSAAPSRRDRALETPLINMNGQGFSGVNPPDTAGDVGAAYYIQMINGSTTNFVIYNKADGSIEAGPVALDSLGSGNCADGLGDPIVLYDELADRWMLSEFSSSGNQLCVYVSQTDDPVSGGFYAYAFTAANGFPDYPKYSVWPDAYYITSNESAPTIYALDRTSMLNGAPASLQSFDASSLSAFGFQALTPADHDGAIDPPAGAPGLFMRHRDTEAHGAGTCTNPATTDCLEIFEFDVDFSTPANSTFGLVQTLEIAEFDSDLCGFTSFECFPQPGTTTGLDPLRELVMWRLQYRNQGSHESLVGNLVTDVDGNDRGGIRWFELRRPDPATPWSVEQQGTHSPDAVNRWMGSIAMDGSGNIALAYNVSDGDSTFPGIRYAGRLQSDPPGTLPQGENTLVAGSAANSSIRYGDYSAMSVDPVDQCTFWFTGEFNAASTWSTRIGAFSFDECTGALEPGFALSSASPLDPAACAGGPAPDIDVDVGSVGGFSSTVTLSHAGLSPGLVDNGFSVNPVSPPASSVASLSVDGGAPSGSYEYRIEGTGDGDTQQLDVELTVFNGLPGATTLQFPADTASDQPPAPTFSWSGSNAAEYLIEIATDAGFANIVDSATVTATQYTPGDPLSAGTTHFWRVTPQSPCGSGSASQTFRFTTADLVTVAFCSTPDASIPPSGTSGTTTDTLTIAQAGQISDVNVSLLGTHTYIGDLDFIVRAPSGTQVEVIDQVCANAADFDITLDDESANGAAGSVCPITDGMAYLPVQPLSGFDGETLNGDWTLTVVDNFGGDSGQLERWCIEATYAAGAAPINCDGADATLIGEVINPGQTVTCNVTNITIQDVQLGGRLIINKSGDADFRPPFGLSPSGRLEINEVP